MPSEGAPVSPNAPPSGLGPFGLIATRLSLIFAFMAPTRLGDDSGPPRHTKPRASGATNSKGGKQNVHHTEFDGWSTEELEEEYKRLGRIHNPTPAEKLRIQKILATLKGRKHRDRARRGTQTKKPKKGENT